METVESLLRGLRIFEKLDERNLQSICSEATVCNYPRGTTVIRQGDRGEAFYVILEGRVKILLAGREGKQTLLGFEDAGGYFGEVAAIDGKPRSACVITMTRVRLLMIKHADFRDCIGRCPEIALALMREMTGRIRTLTRDLHTLRTRNVRYRVLDALGRLARRRGKTMIIDKRPTQQELAEMVGASREMVGRVLRDLADSGLIRIDGSRVLLVAPRETPVRGAP
jgi:CRP-like cAMP-binding protein